MATQDRYKYSRSKIANKRNKKNQYKRNLSIYSIVIAGWNFSIDLEKNWANKSRRIKKSFGN